MYDKNNKNSLVKDVALRAFASEALTLSYEQAPLSVFRPHLHPFGKHPCLRKKQQTFSPLPLYGEG